MKKHQKKKDKGLAVRREVVRFLGSTTARVAGGAMCGATGHCGPCTGTCECTEGCTDTGCTNSWVISY
jgi:hypothetical protein